MGWAMSEPSFCDHAVASRLKEEIARRRISRQGLAETARVSISTLEKALSGRRSFTLSTIVKLEDALGASLREPAEPMPAAPMLAPPEMGSYVRQAVDWIEGDYLTLRASFGDEGATYAYRTKIEWSEPDGHLIFSEGDRLDSTFSQAGFVSMPNLSGHIYLVTSESGQYRLIVLGRATREQRMFGLLSTLQVGAGSQLVPVACPIAYVPLEQIPGAKFGLTKAGDALAEIYREILDAALAQDFCRIRN